MWVVSELVLRNIQCGDYMSKDESIKLCESLHLQIDISLVLSLYSWKFKGLLEGKLVLFVRIEAIIDLAVILGYIEIC